MAEGIVADRELITRKLVMKAAAIIIGFELLIAIVLGWALYEAHLQSVEEECHVLEHRIGAKASFADVLEGLDNHSRQPVPRPLVVDEEVLATYERRCEGKFRLHRQQKPVRHVQENTR